MKNKWKENLPIKLASLLLAIVVWISVTNIVEPVISGFVTVPLSIENESYVYDQNKTYTVLDPRICKINFKGNADQIQLVRQGDFKAYIDLKELTTSTNESLSPTDLTVHFKVYNNVENYVRNIEVEPSNVKVQLSDISRSEKKVTYVVRGDVSEDHSIGSVILSPNVVYVSGSEKEIEKVDKVVIEIPVNNKQENFSGVAIPHLADADGKEIMSKDIVLNVEKINYSVVMYVKKSVAVNAVVEGTVKKGYSYAGAVVYPNSLIINGPRSVVDNIFTIDLPVIDINELSESTSVSYLVKDILPAGIVCNTANAINVNITINDNIINKPEEKDEDVGPHMSNIIIKDKRLTEEEIAALETIDIEE